MKNKIFSSLLAVVMGLVLLAPGALASAFGVSPPWIINENLKPGSSFVYVIDLSTNSSPEDMLIRSVVSGDSEILDWLKVRNSDSIKMRKGEEHAPMYVDIKVPQNAKLGRYKGNIRLTFAPENPTSQNVSVLLGANVAVDLKVISYDVTEYLVKGASLNNSIVEGQNAQVKLRVKNLGNTVLSKIKTDVEFSDYRTGEFVAKKSAEKLVKHVYPHTLEETFLDLPTSDLKIGSYWAKVRALKGSEELYQNRFLFKVDSSPVNNSVKTTLSVRDNGNLKGAAPGGKDQLRRSAFDPTNGVQVRTSVTVRAPLTNQLIGVVIGLLIVLIIVTGKIYVALKKKRR